MVYSVYCCTSSVVYLAVHLLVHNLKSPAEGTGRSHGSRSQPIPRLSVGSSPYDGLQALPSKVERKARSDGQPTFVHVICEVYGAFDRVFVSMRT